MKVYLQSYNNFAQNIAGGVKTKVFNHIESISEFQDIDCHLFNKWSDRIEDCDIIHFFALKPEIYEQVMYAKKLGKKVVISSIVPTVRSQWIRYNIKIGKYCKLHTVYYLNQIILNNADAIITESHKEKDFILKTYTVSHHKIYVIPNGISESVQGGDPLIIKSKFGFDKECIVHVSRIDRNKNQLGVIRAMKNFDIPIVFIGGPDPNDISYYEQCRNEATSCMHFTGWLSHSDPLLTSALAAAKVSVLPSYNETFGYSIYEGLLAGCNVVTSNTIPVGEWLKNDDIIQCNPDDIDDIRSSILRAYQNDRNRDATERVKLNFSFHSIALQYKEIYNRLIL